MRNKIQAALFIFGSISLIALGPRCSSGSTDCTQTSTCPSDASDAPPPVTCDMTKDPKDQPGCLDDRVGLFVSPTGSDMAAGTKEAPMQTIGHALTSAGTLTRVYVCEGTYAEDISIAAPVDGVSIFAGFKCADWSYSGNKAVVGKSQVAFKINATTKPISVQDLAIQSSDGNATSPSSIAALVTSTTAAVSFTRVSFTAGKGLLGSDGMTAGNYSSTLLQNDPTIEGHSATGGGTNNGAAQLCTGLCTDGNVSGGGAGGQGGTSTQGGGSGSPNLSGMAPNDGAGGSGGAVCSNGDNGAVATAVGADGAAATTLGSLSATGWAATVAAAGKNGAPGQGGGGGGGQTFANNSAGGGGGGGCGGCGGGGGAAGQSGGSSIALAVLASNVTVSSSSLSASDAGNGGTGQGGQIGQSGGFKGNGATPGCAGGNGGNGSGGGTGGGGVGGISVGVLYTGNAPTLDTATSAAVTLGKAGSKGIGGKAGTNDGIDGVAQATMQSQ